jgi:hypothetical protein
MAIVPLALRRTDAELCWLLRLLSPLPDGRRRAYVAMSDLRTFGNEWLGVRTIDLHLALSGAWNGVVVHLEDIRDAPSDLGAILQLALDSPGYLDEQIHLSDNLYRPNSYVDRCI